MRSRREVVIEAGVERVGKIEAAAGARKDAGRRGQAPVKIARVAEAGEIAVAGVGTVTVSQARGSDPRHGRRAGGEALDGRHADAVQGDLTSLLNLRSRFTALKFRVSLAAPVTVGAKLYVASSSPLPELSSEYGPPENGAAAVGDRAGSDLLVDDDAKGFARRRPHECVSEIDCRRYGKQLRRRRRRFGRNCRNSRRRR